MADHSRAGDVTLTGRSVRPRSWSGLRPSPVSRGSRVQTCGGGMATLLGAGGGRADRPRVTSPGGSVPAPGQFRVTLARGQQPTPFRYGGDRVDGPDDRVGGPGRILPGGEHDPF